MSQFDNIKRFLLGRELANDRLNAEKLSRFWGLPIMASDALSSVAYAVEEILMALVPALALAATHYVGLVSLPILGLLLVLVVSYTQIIRHYPNGGGAYVVSKENFGRGAALLAATCLVVDYIMTVAVSISSSTAAIVAAFPSLHHLEVPISLACISLITLINLRGISESSKIFGVPTYAFVVAMAAMIVVGVARMIGGNLPPIEYTADQVAQLPAQAMSSITLFLFLKAFSSGCSALSGVEAVSNAIPSFREPSQRTARDVLFMLCGLSLFLFGGASLLAAHLKVVPMEATTVMSQMASAVFGNGFMYYALQFTTSLILLLAANTAYSGLPILLSLLSKDHYMPHQFGQRGTKLSFSNGIMFIFIAAGLLIVVFDADTHKLIPFYAVGVFLSFTLSQAGIFVRWIREKQPGWHYKSLINGLGALVTCVGTVVVFSTKFLEGAWFLLIAVPVIMWFMSITHRHYERFFHEISLEGYDYHFPGATGSDKVPCVVLIHNLNRASLKTLNCALEISSDVTPVHISTTPRHTDRLVKQWEEMGIPIPLTILEAPYRQIIPPLEAYLSRREAVIGKGQMLTVVLTKFVGSGWRDAIYHNQTTFLIERNLVRHRNIATVLVPYLYNRPGARANSAV
jgi:amino acid transporter